MDCRAWEERTSALVDCEVNDQEASSVFAHLAECVSCRRFHRNVLLIRRDLVQRPESFPAVPEEDTDRLQRDAIGGHPASTWIDRAASRMPRRLVLSAAALIMMLVGSTATLLVQGPLRNAPERIIFVGSLPIVEVEATYIPQDTKKL